jgi:hypothetical protein
MSQENVELLRRLWEQFEEGIERGDPGAWVDSEAVAEDFEWVLLWQVADIKDGRLIRVRIYFTATDALEAAGLRL